MPKTTNAGPSTKAAPSPASKPYKRKRRMGEERYYAVRAGRVPGVYTTWAECQANINGFGGAVYKAFPTHKEAMLFAAGKNPNPNSNPDRFYAVAVGKHPGIYTEWADAQAAYTGVRAPKYKKFDSREAAEEWMRSFAPEFTSFGLEVTPEEDEDGEAEEDEILPPTKKLATGLETPFGEGESSNEVQVIYTDGSTLGNGRDGAVAGIGVYFGDGDRRNISERLPGQVQTNQRAELTAILRALQTVSPQQGVLIWSDSMYAIKCVTEWFQRWEANGWKTNKGPVLNRDLVEAVLQEIRKREALGTSTVIKWVKGHEGNRGNVEADELAVAGAKAANELQSQKKRR